MTEWRKAEVRGLVDKWGLAEKVMSVESCGEVFVLALKHHGQGNQKPVDMDAVRAAAADVVDLIDLVDQGVRNAWKAAGGK